MSASGSGAHASSRLVPLTLTALGVVYGDIGTSPLYALRECFFGTHSVPPTHENVLGVLSLIIYSLLIVISVKYVGIVLRADNQGEGGILALTALIPSRNGDTNTTSRLAVGRPLLIALGIVRQDRAPAAAPRFPGWRRLDARRAVRPGAAVDAGAAPG